MDGFRFPIRPQLDGWNTQYLADAARCWMKIMQCWLNGESDEYPPSWEGLYTLLEDVGYPAVATELKTAVGKLTLQFCSFVS